MDLGFSVTFLPPFIEREVLHQQAMVLREEIEALAKPRGQPLVFIRDARHQNDLGHVLEDAEDRLRAT